MQLELQDVLAEGYFIPKSYDSPATAAKGLIELVAETVMDDHAKFSPKMNPGLDTYPTADVRNPLGSRRWIRNLQPRHLGIALHEIPRSH